MKAAGDPALASARTLLMMPDLFNYWLTGVARCELTIASTSQFYNPREKRWATELFDKLGLPTSILAEIVSPGACLGPLLPALAAAGFGGSLVLLSFSHSFALSLLVMLLIGFTMVTGLDASNTLVQRIVPDELRGRVMAIWTMMLSGLAPFGSLVVGVLAQQFTARRTFAAGGMACIMGAMGFGFSLPILQREARKLILKRESADARALAVTKT